jgi:hypothetical protein
LSDLKLGNFDKSDVVIGHDDHYLTRQSVDEPWMKGAIESTRKTLGGAAKEVPPNQVFDFSFVQKTAR